MSTREEHDIQVLEPLHESGWQARFLTFMRRLGFNLKEAQFFAGHLRTQDGQVVSFAAHRASYEIAFRAAERIVKRSRLLGRLNHGWGRNTILLYLAKSLWNSAERVAVQVMVADALACEAGDRAAFLLLEHTTPIDPDLVRGLSPNLDLILYPSGLWTSLKRYRVLALVWWLWRILREHVGRVRTLIERLRNRMDHDIALEGDLPSLLLLQEDDLSLDRSYRTQPHWLFEQDGRPPFRIIVVDTGGVVRLPANAESLEAIGLTRIPLKKLYGKPRPSHQVQDRLREDIRSCVLQSMVGHSEQAEASFTTARLLDSAATLASYCNYANVKAFMTCENYMIQADAIQLIGPILDIHTVSYQYSNLAQVGPLMMTTADTMLTFSTLYHDRWTRDCIRPGSFVNMGYVFDSSFPLVRERALALRSRLEEAGAGFVICYFDESVQKGKYGFISEEDHRNEILSLAQFVLDDPSVGVIVKSQFQRNSPQNLHHENGTLAAALATGRFAEILRGSNRNIIYPAEAAFSADIAIGHVVGATASLEAAQTGVRSILLNPYGLKGDNDTLYARADIVYPTMASALKAIRDYRRGLLDLADLGDWSPIIDEFDPFRDGMAGHRLRNLLELVMRQDVSELQSLSHNMLVDAGTSAPRNLDMSIE